MKKTLVLLTLAMMGFGGYVGYSTNYVETATANEVTIPRFVNVPRTQGFNLDINLNNGLVTCDSQEQDIKINIERKDSIKHVRGLREVPSLRYKRQNLSELCNVKPNSLRIQH